MTCYLCGNIFPLILITLHFQRPFFIWKSLYSASEFTLAEENLAGRPFNKTNSPGSPWAHAQSKCCLKSKENFKESREMKAARENTASQFCCKLFSSTPFSQTTLIKQSVRSLHYAGWIVANIQLCLACRCLGYVLHSTGGLIDVAVGFFSGKAPCRKEGEGTGLGWVRSVLQSSWSTGIANLPNRSSAVFRTSFTFPCMTMSVGQSVTFPTLRGYSEVKFTLGGIR